METIPLTNKHISEISQHYLYDLVVSYGDEVDRILSKNGEEDTESLKEVVIGIGLESVMIRKIDSKRNGNL